MHNLLRSLPPQEKKRWPEKLPELVFWYNTTIHSTTGHSPYMLLFGREPTTPLDWETPDSSEAVADDFLLGHLRRLRDLRDLVLKGDGTSSKDRDPAADLRGGKEKPEKPARYTELKPGDVVLKRQHPPGRNKTQDKFLPQRFTVTNIPSSTNRGYCIDDGQGRQQRVNGSQLKKVPEVVGGMPPKQVADNRPNQQRAGPKRKRKPRELLNLCIQTNTV